MLVYISVYTLYWLILSLLNVATSVNERYDFIIFLSFICGYFAPFKLYGYANDAKEGIPYAMLPASTLEKTTSMVLNCMIITPVSMLLLLFAADTLFTIMPFGVFSSKYIFTTFAMTPQNSIIFGNLLGLEVVISLAMLGNVLFKKHKVSITLLGSIALFIVAMRVFVGCIIDKVQMEEELTSFAKTINSTTVTISMQDIPQSVHVLMNYMQNFLTVFAIVVVVLSLIGIYRKIKTQKY